MNAADLLQNLHSRGVDVGVEGDQLVLRGSADSLPVDVVERARSLKSELLELVRPPVEKLEAEWGRHFAAVRDRLDAHGHQPSTGTLEAAAWIAWSLEGWDASSGIDADTAGEWLEGLLTGRAEGRLDPRTGRPVVWVASGGAAATGATSGGATGSDTEEPTR